MFILATSVPNFRLQKRLLSAVTFLCVYLFSVTLNAQSVGGGAVAIVNILEDGQVAPIWNRGINAFDSAIGWGDCNNDGGAGCPSISWGVVNDSERGNVLQVTHSAAGNTAGLFISSSTGQNASDFADGSLMFDIKVVSGDSNITAKLDCFYPCTSGDQLLGSKGAAGWEAVAIPFSTLATGGLDLTNVDTGLVIWATNATSTVFRLDNVRWQVGEDNTGGTDGATDGSSDGSTPEEPEPEEPAPITVPYDSARAGKLDGSKIWQLPNSPGGDRPDQCWLAVGSDANGEIYISGHDHINNSMMYRMYQSDDTVRWIGDARTASQAANNWLSNETAEKFHTRPIHHEDNVYVATLDNSNMNNGFLNTRGFHWYGYSLPNNSFNDLSASEPNGVGAQTLQLATIQVDPFNNLLYGMSIPENKLVRYDIEQGQTTVLGNPSAWNNFFYTNRFMWVDSRGRVYISGGSSRGQWNQGEPSNVFDHIWYYDPATGFGELTNFALQGPNAMEVGQWDRERKNLYTSDDQGNIYRFNDAAASWEFLGRPNFASNYKTWVFQLSADEEKIYIGQSDGSGPNTIHEFDIASGSSYQLLQISDLDDAAATENFITGYDSWDSQGSFYIADFSMYDGDNVYMLGINPVRIKAAKGILSQLIEVTAVADGEQISLSRSGSASAPLEVLYEVQGFDAQGDLVETRYGTANFTTQQSNLTLGYSSILRANSAEVVSETFSVIPDGNDYVTGAERNVQLDEGSTDGGATDGGTTDGGTTDGGTTDGGATDGGFGPEVDTDLDGIPDSVDTDDDNDGISDIAEQADGTDPLSALSCRSGCLTFDIDRNGRADMLTDGILFLRYTLGYWGEALIDGAVAADASLTSYVEIETVLGEVIRFIGDIDGDGSVDGLTDGILLARYLAGFSGDALIDSAVAENATRTSAADIEAYLQSLMPGSTSTPVGNMPSAVADSYSTNQGASFTANLSGNDSGLEDTPVTYSLNSAAENGSVTVNANGTLSYTPNAGFSGSDSFTYAVTDADGDQSIATVSITVIDANTPFSWPAVNSVVNEDVETAVSLILAQMTIAEKVGQMVQAEIGGVNAAQVGQYNLGSVLNGGGTWPNGKNSSVADWVSLADSFYAASTDTSDGGVGVPVIWGTDAVHGHNNVIGATIFPHNIGLGATNNPGLMRQIGEATALEVAVTGIDWVFAPTLAVVRNDRWGRTYEGYSEDPEIVKAYGGEIVAGLQGQGAELFGEDRVIATAKHFIGDGGTQNGTDQGNTVVTEAELLNIHGQGYLSALAAGAQTVMASYNSWNGSKLHGNEYLLTDVLKQDMGFDGFVIGDWNGHGQVPGCSDNQCAQAIMAGVDMIMVPFAWQQFIQNTITQVQNGTIPMSRIDDAVTRILRVKMRAGFADKVKPSERTYANNTSLLGSADHRAIARQAVRESLVLLKNSDNLLPLAANSNVLVAGSGANDIGKQSGGWTVSWQGVENSNGDFPGGTSIYAGIQSAVSAAGGTTRLSVGGTFSGTTPDVAIVVFGESPYAEGGGDLSSLEYQSGNKSDLALLQSLRAQNIPVVSIFLTGRPLWVNSELNASNAFVAAWLPGTEGGGIADVIFKNSAGQINHDFSGKLSFSWPKYTSQLVLNRNDTDYDPLFAYGFGLTYQDTDTLGDDLDTSGSGGSQPQTLFSVPGTIEAEQYTAMNGIQVEASSDSGGGTGGGENIGYVDVGDWLEYNIDVQTSGSYLIEYRIASSPGSTGFATLIDGVEIDRQAVPNTGDWQNWITQSATVNLQAGEQTLRINAVGALWNLNWIRLSSDGDTGGAGDTGGTGGTGDTGGTLDVNNEVSFANERLVGGLDTLTPGYTLYVFNNDLATPGSSVCNGGCASAWPPVLVEDMEASGVSGLSTIERDDGSKQATHNDRPLYFYAGDSSVDDTRGDGLGGVWWLVPYSVEGVEGVEGEVGEVGEVDVLFNELTARQPDTQFETDVALVTRFSDRPRTRHAREDEFQSYDHYIKFYFEDRSSNIEIVDYVAKGGNSIEMNVRTIFPLDPIQAENRWWYEGLTTVAQYASNGVMTDQGFDGTYYNYQKISNENTRLGRPIQLGDRLEFEISQFSAPGIPRGQANYYGTTFLYIVGEGIVPWYAEAAGSTYREDSQKIPEEYWLGGHTTIHHQYTDEPNDNFLQMATNLGYDNGQKFLLGRRVHHSSVINGAHDEDPANGVLATNAGLSGSRYINQRCTGCHERNGGSGVANNGVSLDRWVFKVGDANGAPDPLIGSVLQPSGSAGEGNVSIASWTEGADGLRTPNYQFSQGTPATFSARIAPRLIGLGLLEAIPETAILALEDPDDADGDGISGRANKVIDPENSELTRLGRFGWKAATSSVKHQVAAALNTDMGVRTSVLPNPDCGSAQTNCGESSPLMPEENLENLILYISALGVRPQRVWKDGVENQEVLQGREQFRDIGCAGCHTESFQTSEFHPLAEVRDQTIHPYSDMLLHYMGEGLADNLGEGLASGGEWRTTPLWGLGLSACVTGGVTNPTGREGGEICTPDHAYLHDGRARSIEEAILWHGIEGSEGKSSTDAYKALSEQNQQSLLRFLESL